MAKIDHAAIRTSSYEDAQKFFEDVFDMHMWREIGEKPERKCWFREGIQLCEVSAINTDAENGYDHISIAVDSVEKTMEKIKAYPVKPINDHWFSLPDGTRIELKLLANWKVNFICTNRYFTIVTLTTICFCFSNIFLKSFCVHILIPFIKNTHFIHLFNLS